MTLAVVNQPLLQKTPDLLLASTIKLPLCLEEFIRRSRKSGVEVLSRAPRLEEGFRAKACLKPIMGLAC